MVNLAKTARADFVEFQAMDLIKEKTDHLCLDREHRESLERQFKALRGRVDYVRTVEYYKAPWNAGRHRKEAEEFGRFLYESREGFQYDPVTDRAVCPAGRSSHPRIDGELPDSDAYPLAFHFRTHPLRGEEHFKFRKEDCNGCPYFQTCFSPPSMTRPGPNSCSTPFRLPLTKSFRNTVTTPG